MSARARRHPGAALLLALAFAAAVSAAPPARAQEEPDPRLPAPRLPAGYSLVEGDVLVRTDELGKPNPGRFSTFQVDKLWPGGIVPFAYDTSVANYPSRVLAVQSAMSRLTAANYGSAVLFVPRTSESDYVYYVADTASNYSPVGRQGGRQDIHVVSWGSPFVLDHETMHSLGFWHEQSRSDRDTYVTIHTENICTFCCDGGSCAYNFQKEGSSSAYGPYDFDSIMHYSKCAFLSPSLFCPGNYTIEVNPPYAAWQDLIGQRNHLSRLDRVSLSFLYALGNWRFVDGNAGGPGTGAFLDPWPDFATGVWSTPSGGTLYVQPGSYLAPFGGLSTPMRIEAPLGSVQVTAAPSLATRVRRP